MDMMLAKNMKGNEYLTNILDPYPEAMMLKKTIFSNDNTKVYKIEDKSGAYVLKVKDLKLERKKEEFEILEHEYKSTKKLGKEHPHFIKAIDFKSIEYTDNNQQQKTRVEILLKYGGPDLNSLMEKATDKQITEWMLQSVSALLYSEKRKISHFDIKPKNMVFENGILKIIDMGAAIEFARTSTFYKPVGEEKKLIIGRTEAYAPPELINGDSDLKSVVCGKVDVYCWAMSFYQLVSKIKNSEMEEIKKIRIVDEDEEKYNKFLNEIRKNSKLKEFDKKKVVTKAIIGCLKYKPEDRLLFEDVQELLKELVDEEYENEETAKSLYYSIGCSYMDKVDNKGFALKYFLKEISIYRKTLTKAKLLEKYEIENIWSAYNEVGSAYDNIGNYTEALSNYEKALNISRKILGEEHSSTAYTYNSIGSTYNKMVEYEIALSYFDKAMIIYKKTLGEEHSSIADAYHNIGSTYNKMRKYEIALNNYEKALNIYRKTLGEENSSIAATYYNIGNTCEGMGKYRDALGNYEKAWKIYKKTLGKEHSYTANTYNNIGNIHYQMDEYVNALKYYEKALKIYKKILGKEHSYTADTYYNIGSTYNKMGNYEKALNYFNETLKIYKKNLGENHADTAATYYNIGVTYESMSDNENALINYEKALNIRKEVLGEDHDETILTCNKIKGVNEKMKYSME